ncbi:MAG: integrase core domain-containing protein, partial [Elusimicrobiales bacterium]
MTLFKEGIKRYIITAIDLKSRFAFAYAYTNLSSRSAKDFMDKLEYVSPFKIKKVQTDNGSEFERYFDEYLKRNEITHYYNYPRHPQSNAHIERFNRTLKESFVEVKGDDIFGDIGEYNKELMEWLVWYNGERYHKSIKMTPMEYLIKE